jgi:aminocarboxymuconate-semialdehyde decarboxylase
VSRRFIDVHAHFPLRAPSGAKPEVDPDGVPGASWNALAAIDFLDRFEIETQFLSLPHLFASPPDRPGQAAAQARAVNERFAGIVADHPGRFGAYATVPADTVDGALEEMSYALGPLGLDGVCLTSHSHGRYLGDPFFEPVVAEAERRSVPVFLHPTAPAHAEHLALGRPPFLVEFPFDTARSVVDAVYAGVFDRHPSLRLIVAHCGGALPALAWRVTHLADLARRSDECGRPAQVASALRRLYFETALSGAASVVRATLDLIDPSHLLYGHGLRCSARVSHPEKHARPGTMRPGRL